MTLVLGSGAVSALSTQRARLIELRRRGLWPPLVPSVVLVEALTGDPRRDFSAERFLRTCEVLDVNAVLSRTAARLRAATTRAGTISAVDAVVAAVASGCDDPVIVTSDPHDLRTLGEHCPKPVTIVAV